ncbi:MAG: cell division protein FtsA [Bacteroidales bacterium]|nr:cell division protein FtsA [Bacteroidales bacterium]
MKTNIVVGLDIGTTKIAVIVAQKNEHGKIEILGIGDTPSAGVMRGSVMNIDKTVESIRIAVEKAELISHHKIKDVYVGIAGQHIRSFQRRNEIIRTSDEEITKAEVEDFVNLMKKIQVEPGEKILHVIPQEFIVDNVPEINDPVGMSGRTLAANFHIITGQYSAIKNIQRSVEKAGLEVKDLILEPLASALAVLDDKDCAAGVALVDIGGGTTDIAIYHHDDKPRHTAVIALGGNAITEDIQSGCLIIDTQAKKLKEEFGYALAEATKEDVIISIPGLRGRPAKEISRKNLSGIIQARMEEILELVLNEIRASGYENKLIAGIVLTGGGAKLKHVIQLTEFVTRTDTRIGYPTEHLSASEKNNEIANPAYATGVGLVMAGFDLEEPLEIPKIEESPIEENPVEELPAAKPKKQEKNRSKSLWISLKKRLLDGLDGFMENDIKED